MKLWRSVMLVLALLFIAAATLTPGSASPSGALPADFWCFACGPFGGADVIVNVVLFIPLGIALSLYGVHPGRALVYGALISGAVELAQAFGHPPFRVASASDLATNSLGTLLGACLGRYRVVLLTPTRTQARALGVASVVLVSTVLGFSAWALALPAAEVRSPVLGVEAVAVTDTEPGVRLSNAVFAPGFGWYHGLVSEAAVNNVTFARQGDGPLMLEGIPRPEYHLVVRTTGRDERAAFVPFLYLQNKPIEQPALMLGQRGAAAELRVQLRGASWRLPGPVAVLPDVFPQGSIAQQTLDASVSSSVWTLAASTGPRRLQPLALHESMPQVSRQVRLRVSLALGWSLFQQVLRTDGVAAAAMSLSWLFVLWFPVGYWCTGATRPKPVAAKLPAHRASWLLAWRGPLLACCVLIPVSIVAPVAAGISTFSVPDWSSAVGGLLAGAVAACIVYDTQRQHPVSAHPV